jgi:hypothetical protein
MSTILKALGRVTRLKLHFYPGPNSPHTKKRTRDDVSSAFSIWRRGSPASFWSYWRKEKESWRLNG